MITLCNCSGPTATASLLQIETVFTPKICFLDGSYYASQRLTTCHSFSAKIFGTVIIMMSQILEGDMHDSQGKSSELLG